MSQPKVYVGNLAYSTSKEKLQEVFGEYGNIVEIKPIIDRETGRSKGFAFITFEDQQAAQQSLSLNGTEVDGRRIKVNLAREEERGSQGGGGGRGNYGGGGGGGFGGERRRRQ